MLKSSGSSFADTPWFTRVCVNSITGLEMQRLPCVCVRPRAHEGGRGPLWITTVFWSRVEHSSEWIRGAHKTRQGNAAGQVMPSPGNNGLMCEAWHWSGSSLLSVSCSAQPLASRVMSCLFSGFSNSLFKNWEKSFFSPWNERENSFQRLELISEAIFPPNWGTICFD